MSNKSSLRLVLLASAALAPAIFGGAAWAADSAPATAKAPPPPAAQGQDIVVTATRQSQTLSKVAESVSAFTAAKLDVQGVKSFASLAKFTPGVTFDEDRHDVSIRGISSQAGSGTTGVYIDDTPIQIRALGLNANNTLPAVFDLDRVEVLRGPQGTLFGAGSEGGTVRYITPQPSLTTYSGYGHTELATTAHGAPSYEAGVAVGGPIIQDVLGFRASAWARRDGGWIDSVDYQTGAVTDKNANRTDTYVLRLALAWQPTAKLLITPAINFQKADEHTNSVYWTDPSFSNPSAGVFRDGTPDRMADPDRFYLPSLKIEYDFGAVKFISNTSYFNRRENVNGYSGTLYNLSYFQHFTTNTTPSPVTSPAYVPGLPANPVDPQLADCPGCVSTPLLNSTGPSLPGFGPYVSYNTILNTQENFTQEFRLQSNEPNARLNWVTGLFYSHNSQRSKEEIHDPQLPALTEYLFGEDMLTAWGEDLLPNGDDYINDTKAHDQQIALFADGTFAITEKLKLTAGVRYAWTHFDFTNLNDGAQDLLDDGGVPATASGKKDETPLTPKIGLSYQITPDDMVYTTIAKGYRIGGASPPLPVEACGGVFPTQYNSDTVLSYEIGGKGRFFDRRLQVSASAYYIDWSNIQQAVQVPACGIQYTTNLGSATSKGFDIQSQFKLTSNLSIEWTVGYTDAEYSKTAVDPSDPTGASLLAIKGDAVGLQIVPVTATVGAQYNFSVLDHAGFVRADYEYNSHRTRRNIFEDPSAENYDPGLVPDPATNQVSARAGISFDKLDMALYVENALDSHPQLNLQHQDSGTALYEAETLRPRTIGVSLSYRY